MFRYPTLGTFQCFYRQVSGLKSIFPCPSPETRQHGCAPSLTRPVPWEPRTNPAKHSPAANLPRLPRQGTGQRAARRRPTLWTLLASRPPEGSERRRAAASPGGDVGGARALRHASCFLLLLPKMAADSTEQFCVAEERSGHCAVVDGNFLYVWGGYVVRREEAGGGRRGRAKKGREERESEGGAQPRGGGGARRLTGLRRAGVRERHRAGLRGGWQETAPPLRVAPSTSAAPRGPAARHCLPQRGRRLAVRAARAVGAGGSNGGIARGGRWVRLTWLLWGGSLC